MPRPKPFRFSLRTLLTAVTLLAVAFGGAGWRLRVAHDRQAMKNWIVSNGGEVRTAGPDGRKHPGMIGLIYSDAGAAPQPVWGRPAQLSLSRPLQTGWVVEGERRPPFKGRSMQARPKFVAEIDVPAIASKDDWARIRQLFPDATLFREVAGPFPPVPSPLPK